MLFPRRLATDEPEAILINPAHVRTARQSGSAQVTLVMDDGEGGGYQTVVGDRQNPFGETLTRTPAGPDVDLRGD